MASSEEEWNRAYEEARGLVEKLRQRLGVRKTNDICMGIINQVSEAYTEDQLRQCAVYHALIGSTVTYNGVPYFDVEGGKMMELLRQAVREYYEGDTR
ncbi:MAG: hypothetical protein GXP43_00025 [bacterium]|nr:hypothetical protein [bacterium]